MDTKLCSKCGIPKSLDDYYTFLSKGKIYKRSLCKLCYWKKAESQKDKEKSNLTKKNWRTDNPKKVKEAITKYFKRINTEITTVYVKKLIVKAISVNNKVNIKFSDIPSELIELKRKELTLKQKIKQNG